MIYGPSVAHVVVHTSVTRSNWMRAPAGGPRIIGVKMNKNFKIKINVLGIFLKVRKFFKRKRRRRLP